MKIPRPALRYYGGKFRLADWIIEHFPAHDCYVEPFGGGANVLLSKYPSGREVYNDIDSSVVTFFKVLRDHEEELLRVLNLTPFSREEYRLAYLPAEDQIETARRFFVRSWQGVGGARRQNATGWRFERDSARGQSVVDDWCNIQHLPVLAQRLRQVQIENDDAVKVIRRYDSPRTLFYVDPPYLGETRGQRWAEKGYMFEMTAEDHEHLAEALHSVKGMVILSGYPSAKYDHLYPGWRVDLKQSRINSLGKGCRLHTEALYISPAAADGIKQQRLLIPSAAAGDSILCVEAEDGD